MGWKFKQNNYNPIESTRWDGTLMALVAKGTNAAISVGDVYTDDNGVEHVIKGGMAPHKPSSNGKLWGDWLGTYYTHILDAEWVEA